MSLPRCLTAVAALGVITLIVAACGSADTTSEQQTAGAGGGASTMTDGSSLPLSGSTVGTTTVDVALGKASEFSLAPSVETVPAGEVTFNVVNDGKAIHELVVVKTDTSPEQLTQEDGTADESTSVGEAADITAGDSKALTLTLTPGSYVLLCNLPGHYAAGMYRTFVVTP